MQTETVHSKNLEPVTHLITACDAHQS